jgi:hypothetical protein
MSGRRLGAIGSSGSLVLSGLPAGSGKIELRHEGRPSREIPVELKAGETQEIQAAVSEAAANSTLTLSWAPSEATPTLTLRRSDGGIPQEVKGGRVSVAPGSYVVEARAAGFQPARSDVQIEAGATKAVRLELQPVSRPRAGGVVDYMSLWVSQPGWVQRGDQVVRRGGEFVYFPVNPQFGIYRFSAIRQTGDSLHWFLTFGDQSDHWFFELQRRRFERIRVSGGKRERESRYDSGVDRSEPFEVEIDVRRTLVITRITRNGAVIAEDSLQAAGGRLDSARWGFWLDKGDQIALTRFTFEPK